MKVYKLRRCKRGRGVLVFVQYIPNEAMMLVSHSFIPFSLYTQMQMHFFTRGRTIRLRLRVRPFRNWVVRAGNCEKHKGAKPTLTTLEPLGGIIHYQFHRTFAYSFLAVHTDANALFHIGAYDQTSPNFNLRTSKSRSTRFLTALHLSRSEQSKRDGLSAILHLVGTRATQT